MVNKKTLMLISTIFLISLLGVAIFLPMYVNAKYKKIDVIDKKNNIKEFFTNKDINKNQAKNFTIVNKLEKKDILNSLTNYLKVYDLNLLSFDNKLIKSNLLNIIKNKILLEQKQFNNNNIYLQLRYELVNDDELKIDIRWTQKNNYLALYYDQGKINISIV